MFIFFEILGIKVPLYGTMITLGILVCNIVAILLIKLNNSKKLILTNTKLNIWDLIILEGYCFLGCFIGSKGLYIVTIANNIDWTNMTTENFNLIMQGGFVFLGGLIFGILAVILAGKIHKIDSLMYIKVFITLVPLGHAFGRIGCFFAGCCYGIPYDGPFAVVFPTGGIAPSGIPLFPVQLVESVCLLVIFIICMIVLKTKQTKFTIETYIISYSIVRFTLEFYRYDEYRGIYFGFSTSQWLCMILFTACIISLVVKTLNKNME